MATVPLAAAGRPAPPATEASHRCNAMCGVEGPNTPPTINAPLREGKGFLYEGGIRVPLIVRWPGVTKAGAVAAAPVSSIDFFPTVCEACAVKSDAKVDGVSFVPALKGEPLKRDALYWHYP